MLSIRMIITNNCISRPLNGRERKVKLVPSAAKSNGNNPVMQAGQIPVENPANVPRLARNDCCFKNLLSFHLR